MLYDDLFKLITNRFAAYHPHYYKKPEMNKSVSNPPLFKPPQKQITLLYALSDVVEANITWFTSYQPYKKEKPLSNSTLTFDCAANFMYFLYNLESLFTTTLITCNSSICAAEPGLVTKKENQRELF